MDYNMHYKHSKAIKDNILIVMPQPVLVLYGAKELYLGSNQTRMVKSFWGVAGCNSTFTKYRMAVPHHPFPF